MCNSKQLDSPNSMCTYRLVADPEFAKTAPQGCTNLLFCSHLNHRSWNTQNPLVGKDAYWPPVDCICGGGRSKTPSMTGTTPHIQNPRVPPKADALPPAKATALEQKTEPMKTFTFPHNGQTVNVKEDWAVSWSLPIPWIRQCRPPFWSFWLHTEHSSFEQASCTPALSCLN